MAMFNTRIAPIMKGTATQIHASVFSKARCESSVFPRVWPARTIQGFVWAVCNMLREHGQHRQQAGLRRCSWAIFGLCMQARAGCFVRVILSVHEVYRAHRG